MSPSRLWYDSRPVSGTTPPCLWYDSVPSLVLLRSISRTAPFHLWYCSVPSLVLLRSVAGRAVPCHPGDRCCSSGAQTMLLRVPLFPSPVQGRCVARPAGFCLRFGHVLSPACIFGRTCYANRPLSASSVAVQLFFADLLRYKAGPATQRGETCRGTGRDLQRSGPGPAPGGEHRGAEPGGRAGMGRTGKGMPRSCA